MKVLHQKDFVLLGDRGYLSESIQLDLFQTVKVKLETPKRTNQKDYKPQPYIFRKSRKRIETLFSQLCDQFLIRRNYAKSFEGFLSFTYGFPVKFKIFFKTSI